MKRCSIRELGSLFCVVEGRQWPSKYGRAGIDGRLRFGLRISVSSTDTRNTRAYLDILDRISILGVLVTYLGIRIVHWYFAKTSALVEYFSKAANLAQKEIWS